MLSPPHIIDINSKKAYNIIDMNNTRNNKRLNPRSDWLARRTLFTVLFISSQLASRYEVF